MPTTARSIPLKGEEIIQLKNVPALPLFLERPTFRQVQGWVKYGIRGVRLERRREGGRLFTSVEAVARFLEATQ